MDKELETVRIDKKTFFKIARDRREYERDIVPTDEFLEKLCQTGADVFTLIERKWYYTLPNPRKSWLRTKDNIALLRIASYDEWWRSVGNKTRNMIRKAEKSGIRIEIAEPDEKLAEGMWEIYNETPIRQKRAFPHYGASLNTVIRYVISPRNCTYIGAYFQNKLSGFIQLVNGDHIVITSQLLSLEEHWDKAINNALMAKAVEVCANQNVRFLMYGRMGNHPTLDRFKQNNGYIKFDLVRFYIPLTRKGKIATKLSLHREMKDVLPQSVKYRLIPLYNWVSRTKMKAKLTTRPK